MRSFFASVAGLVLLAGTAGAAASPVAMPTRSSDVFDTWSTAEKADLQVLSNTRNTSELERYKALLAADRQAMTSQLNPVFTPGESGWIDCDAARKAMVRALNLTSTGVGLESILVMGLRVERYHCQASPYTASSPDWKARLPSSLLNVQGRLPPAFTQTRAVMTRTAAPSLMAAATARAFASADSVCMGEQLTQSRARGERFQEAQRRALQRCTR